MLIRLLRIAIIPAVFAAVFAVAAYCWPAPAAAPKGKNDALSSIRRQVVAIENGTVSCRRVERELDWDVSAEGSCLTAFFKGKSLVKIVARFYGEMGCMVEEYYYSGNSLIFVLRTSFLYDEPIGCADADGGEVLKPKVVSRTTDRFYFQGVRLVRWDGHKLRDFDWTGGNPSDERTRLLDSSRKLRKEALAASSRRN